MARKSTKQELNAQKVRGLKPDPKKRTQIFDESQPGLALRIAPSGVKSWSVVYKKAGRMKRYTLGLYPAISLASAREKARDALHDVAHGEDPQEEKVVERDAGTFAQLAELYIEEHSKPTKASWREDQRQLNAYLLPVWKHVKAAALTIDDIEVLLDGLKKRGPVQANRTRALLRHMYTWALSQRSRRKRFAIETNPCAYVARPAEETARTNVFSDDELKAIWKACGTIGIVGELFKLQVLTGTRKGELASMEWSELDLKRALWTQPDTKTKNRKVHVVPLSTSAVQILEGLQKRQARLKNKSKRESKFVFCSSRTGSTSVTWLQKAAERVSIESKVKPFRAHDLRRTCATRLAEAGVPETVLKLILNHSLGKDITGVYNQYKYFEERKTALQTWSGRLAAITSDLKLVKAGEGSA